MPQSRKQALLDALGKFFMDRYMDRGIADLDDLCAGRWKAPGRAQLQADIAALDENAKDVLRHTVLVVLDTALHDLLFGFQEEYDRGGRISLRIDGEEAAALSDGLQGEPYGDNGWRAKFSKHGSRPDLI